MDGEREIAAETLGDARRVLADLILIESTQGHSTELAGTRRELDAEIQTLEQALSNWDEWIARREESGR